MAVASRAAVEVASAAAPSSLLSPFSALAPPSRLHPLLRPLSPHQLLPAAASLPTAALPSHSPPPATSRLSLETRGPRPASHNRGGATWHLAQGALQKASRKRHLLEGVFTAKNAFCTLYMAFSDPKTPFDRRHLPDVLAHTGPLDADSIVGQVEPRIRDWCTYMVGSTGHAHGSGQTVRLRWLQSDGLLRGK